MNNMRSIFALLSVLVVCACAREPSERDMQGAIEANFRDFGGLAAQPLFKAAVEKCRRGGVEIKAELGAPVSCEELCGKRAAGECDLSVAVSQFAKGACESVPQGNGIYECTYRAIVHSDSPWLNGAIHAPPNPSGAGEGKAERKTRFQKLAGQWIVVELN